MMVGRTQESAWIGRLLSGAREGTGGSLVIRGEAGIGKTALLDHAAEMADGMRLLRGVGIESEIEVPFAGLHLLLHPYLDRIEALPGPHAEALRTAFGLTGTGVSERFLIGAATLSLLSELAGESPLVCLVDDAQWFDKASADALLFAARRLRFEPVAMLFAVREGTEAFPTPGIDAVALERLDRASSITLLNQCGQSLAGPNRARILAEAQGNPLAIIEFAAALIERRGPARALPVEPLPVAGRLQDAFRERIARLPDATQRMLLLAAADDTADLAVVLRAAEKLGLSEGAMEPAEQARLIEFNGDAVTFRHPLIRAAAYRGAPHSWLAGAHRALADTLTAEQYADRRAWHRAAATTLPDEAVAAELEDAARRAAQRGGSAAVATALERAARLSTDQVRKGRRLIGAARAAYDAGWLDRAAEFAATGAELASDASTLAEATWIQAQVSYEHDSPGAAAALMLQGALPILETHPEQAVSILTDAIGCAKDAGAHDLIRRCARMMQTVPLKQDSGLWPVAEGMIGLGNLIDGHTARGFDRMRMLVTAARDGLVLGLVERVLAGYLALIVAEDEAAADILATLAADARRQGSLGWLPYAQEPLAIAQLLHGRFRDAETTVTEALSVSDELGQQTQSVVLQAIPAWLAAVAGDDTACTAAAETVLRHQARHPTNAALAGWALGLLDLVRGRFDAAADRLEAVCTGPARQDFLVRAIPDQLEAAVRSGRTASQHLPVLRHWAEHTGQPHASALVHRCRALLATTGDDVEQHYEAALRGHDEAARPYDYARTALLYGEWQRRQRRRAEAQTHLSQALSTFEHLGAYAWAARARGELIVLGDRPAARPHDNDPVARLTPQERQVVQLAAAGLSNRDIAAQLFLSPRTVSHHLYRAYPKLGITRRTELGRFAFSDR
jgi:DNA-binding CsgD family transcriptional regulator